LQQTYQKQKVPESCQTIQNILVAYGPGNAQASGVVIDARGTWSTSQLQNCSVNPWGVTFPPTSTVLLPAATITISSSWILPANTRIVGEGPQATIIQAASGFGATNYLIDMGQNSTTLCGNLTDCQGIVIEHLGLAGNANGIRNQWSQELSYVNDVAFTSMTGTGLTLQSYPQRCNFAPTGCTGDSHNSGPYTNISYSGSGSCVNIDESGGRGIHGLTCISSATTGAFVILNGLNNTLENVSVIYSPSQNGPAQSTADGILVGNFSGSSNQLSGAQGNLLMNISGSNLGSIVHISGNTSMYSSCPPGPGVSGNTPNVCGLTILGVTGAGNGATTILDSLTGATVTDPYVGMYIVGEQVLGGPSAIGTTRLTTSTSIPSWVVASGSATINGACSTGALYSCTSNCSSGTIFVCFAGGWQKILQ
jgi:hypothetical protein